MSLNPVAAIASLGQAVSQARAEVAARQHGRPSVEDERRQAELDQAEAELAAAIRQAEQVGHRLTQSLVNRTEPATPTTTSEKPALGSLLNVRA